MVSPESVVRSIAIRPRVYLATLTAILITSFLPESISSSLRLARPSN